MALSAESDRPFALALRDLQAELDMSFRRLRVLTGEHRDRPYSLAYLGQLAQGEQQPTLENMEVIAAAVGIEATHFIEYRRLLAMARASALVDQVGLIKVLEGLESVAPKKRRKRKAPT